MIPFDCFTIPCNSVIILYFNAVLTISQGQVGGGIGEQPYVHLSRDTGICMYIHVGRYLYTRIRMDIQICIYIYVYTYRHTSIYI